MAIRLGRSPSQLLLPLAFGAHAGSLLTLTGTPVNVIVSEAAARRRRGRFGYFDVRARRRAARRRDDRDRRALRRAPAARPRRARGSRRLQPARAHADRAVRARPAGDRAAHPPVRRRRGRDPAALGADRRDASSRAWSPRAATSSCSRSSARARTRTGETVLAVGDTLLLQGTWDALDEHLDDPDVLVVDAPDARPAAGGAARPGREARARRPRRDGRPARDRRRAAGRRRPARRGRDRPRCGS